MRIVVIGATGHVGGYLVPRLVHGGHEVLAVSRNGRPRYHHDAAWNAVEHIRADREAEDAAGTFGPRIADLGADVVIDMICFTATSAAQLVEALRGRIGHLVMCSTIWVKGWLAQTPASEDDESEPWGEYGIAKAQIEALLSRESLQRGGLPSITLRPGHISGPGWPVINPVGNLDPSVWETLASGGELVLPHAGLETLHHVHADDVAQAFERAATRMPTAGAERFNIVSPHAVTLRGLATTVAHGFGQPANLRFVDFEQFRAQTTLEHANVSFEHIMRSHCMSITHAQTELGYSPRYRSIDAIAESVNWAAEHGQLSLGGRVLRV